MIHKGSEDTYNYIANWYDCSFPFSKSDGWGRYGILGVLGDMFLYGLKGDILEIGVGESSIYLSEVARKHNRKIYLCDIGAGKITNPQTVPGYLKEDSITFVGSSDRLFKEINISPIAIAFIDGDHSYDQVKKDFWNLVPLMVEDGIIFLHDTYPPDESYIHENKCGTVYKLRQDIEEIKKFDCFTFTKTVGIGVGVTMVRIKPKELPYYKQ